MQDLLEIAAIKSMDPQNVERAAGVHQEKGPPFRESSSASSGSGSSGSGSPAQKRKADEDQLLSLDDNIVKEKRVEENSPDEAELEDGDRPPELEA